eukprot:Em0003g663a
MPFVLLRTAPPNCLVAALPRSFLVAALPRSFLVAATPLDQLVTWSVPWLTFSLRYRPSFQENFLRSTSHRAACNADAPAHAYIYTRAHPWKRDILKGTCPRCGKTEHTSKDCPFITSTCHGFCQKLGHIESACLQKRRGSQPVRNITKRGDPKDETLTFAVTNSPRLNLLGRDAIVKLGVNVQALLGAWVPSKDRQALLHEPSPTLASVNNLLILEKLKCALCSNVLSQPLELTCSALVFTKYLTECTAASGAVNCSFCSEDDLSHVRPASNAILLCCYQMLEDIMLVATGTLEVVIMKGMSVYHHIITPEEEKQAAGLLKRAISISPDKGVVQLATGGAVKEVF